MTRIPVRTPSRSYEVMVKRGLLRSSAEVIAGLVPAKSRVFAVTQRLVRKPWGDALRESFADQGRELVLLEMLGGERSKRLSQLERLAGQMVKQGADRRSVVVAFGGGVVGDVAGMLASIFMRGVPVVQVPTTLVAQVDSAIGGKTGVNLTAGKNLLGTFYQPLAVLADPDVLATLPEREYRSGLFEAMKYGVIRNPAIVELMEAERDALLRRDGTVLEKLIVESVKVKAEVVSADERESGERRILNFGHTIGHALESETGYKHFLHGEAVGWGMMAATMIGAGMGITDGLTAQRILALVLAYAPLPEVEVDSRRIARRLGADKKTVGGVPHFILPASLGKVEVVNTVPMNAVLHAVEEIKSLSKA